MRKEFILFIVAAVYAGGLFLSPSAPHAHEFWVDPKQWVVTPGDDLDIALRVGTGFDGSQQVYLPNTINRYDVIGPGAVKPVSGRIGDIPAGKVMLSESGLHIICHETRVTLMQYDAFEKFARFADEKGFPDAVRQHRLRNLPETNFIETYQRFAKSLVAVGNATGRDQVIGMDVEITAMTNPFDADIETMVLQLNRDGQIWPEAQITVFARPVGGLPDQTTTATYHTDSKGLAEMTVLPDHLYLIDAVSLEAVDPSNDPNGAVWFSRWASLTFATVKHH